MPRIFFKGFVELEGDVNTDRATIQAALIDTIEEVVSCGSVEEVFDLLNIEVEVEGRMRMKSRRHALLEGWVCAWCGFFNTSPSSHCTYCRRKDD